MTGHQNFGNQLFRSVGQWKGYVGQCIASERDVTKDGGWNVQQNQSYQRRDEQLYELDGIRTESDDQRVRMRFSPMNPIMTDCGNLRLSFMSFWKVGNEAVPPYANMTVPNAKKHDSTEILPAGATVFVSRFFCRTSTISIRMRTTAKVVVASAPAAAGQNSLGVPKNVSGQRTHEMMMIHMQKQTPVDWYADFKVSKQTSGK